MGKTQKVSGDAKSNSAKIVSLDEYEIQKEKTSFLKQNNDEVVGDQIQKKLLKNLNYYLKIIRMKNF